MIHEIGFGSALDHRSERHWSSLSRKDALQEIFCARQYVEIDVRQDSLGRSWVPLSADFCDLEFSYKHRTVKLLVD